MAINSFATVITLVACIRNCNCGIFNGNLLLNRHAYKNPGPPRCITDEEEAALVEYIEYMAARRSDMRLIIRDLIERSGRPCLFDLEHGPSDQWFRGFLERHPAISEKVPQTREAARARISREDIVDDFYSLYGIFE